MPVCLPRSSQGHRAFHGHESTPCCMSQRSHTHRHALCFQYRLELKDYHSLPLAMSALWVMCLHWLLLLSLCLEFDLVCSACPPGLL